MEIIKDRKDCCGCTACFSICPKSAIEMKPDNEGFLYPVINKQLCIDCGLCKKVCNLQLNKPNRNIFPYVYGVKNKNKTIRLNSTSGGAFPVIAEYIINNGGSVYGAAFDDNFDVVHVKAEQLQQLNSIRGTKYVQSDVRGIYNSVFKDLTNQRSVLFTGTPCQCDGLRKFLTIKNCDMSSLLLCDIVCHGVPSPGVWHDYIKKITNRKSIKNYCFRDKRIGWHGANIRVEFEDGKILSNTVMLRSFVKLYFNNYISRPSCGKCRYANFDRCSDITIGDFWGIENVNPAFDDKNGVSLVLINTEKGKDVFDNIKVCFDYFESNTKSCEQEQLKHPQRPSSKRNKFWERYNSRSFDYIIRRYGGCNVYGKLRRAAYNMLKIVRK